MDIILHKQNRKTVLQVWMVFLAGLLGCESTPQIPIDIIPTEEGLVEEAWDVVMRIRIKGRPRVEIQAGYLARYAIADTTYLRLRPDSADTEGLVQAIFFDEAGNPNATLTTLEIIYHDEQQRFEAIGNVVVQTEAGNRLETERLHWKEEEQKIRTDGFVRITTPKEQIQGYQLVADEGLTNYEISRITGQITLDLENG